MKEKEHERLRKSPGIQQHNNNTCNHLEFKKTSIDAGDDEGLELVCESFAAVVV